MSNGTADSANTLMNSYKALEETIKRFKRLAAASDIMVAKFERNIVRMDIVEGKEDIPEPPPRNIIELFNDINTQLNILSEKVEINISEVSDLIE